MINSIFLARAIVGLTAVALASSASAAIPFFDNFDDGDFGGWSLFDATPNGDGSIAVIDDELVLSSATPVDNLGSVAATLEQSFDNADFQDGVYRADVNTNNTNAQLAARISTDFSEFYIFNLRPTDGRIELIRNNTVEAFAFTDFSSGEDWTFEATLSGPDIELRAWLVGETRPIMPRLAFTDADPLIGTGIGLLGDPPANLSAPLPIDIAFDNVSFIPEPTTAAVLGLFAVSASRRRR